MWPQWVWLSGLCAGPSGTFSATGPDVPSRWPPWLLGPPSVHRPPTTPAGGSAAAGDTVPGRESASRSGSRGPEARPPGPWGPARSCDLRAQGSFLGQRGSVTAFKGHGHEGQK